MTTYLYGLVNRPPGLGAVPKGQVAYDPSNAGIAGVRHGVISYDRKLSDAEVKSFELLPLGVDGNPIAHVRFPPAVLKKAQEAVDTLNYLAENPMDDPAEANEHIDAALKVLKIFRDYGKSKRLDADKALTEIGYKPENYEKAMVKAMVLRVN